MEMYEQGASTRRVKAITEELCGHEFSASAVSAINQKLDEALTRFMTRRLGEEYPYLTKFARGEQAASAGGLTFTYKSKPENRCPSAANHLVAAWRRAACRHTRL